jgi:hypothetical protein
VEPVSENAARAAHAARIAGRRVSGPGFKFDEVGDWSILKLNIIENYAGAYTKAFSKHGQHLRKYYIDGFSGAGLHHAKGTRKQIDGSPMRHIAARAPPTKRLVNVRNANPKQRRGRIHAQPAVPKVLRISHAHHAPQR